MDNSLKLMEIWLNTSDVPDTGDYRTLPAIYLFEPASSRRSPAHLTEVAMFRHILLPTDGSVLSQVAIRKGVHLAKSLKARITGISVMPEPKFYLYQTDIIAQVKEETVRQHQVQASRNLAFIEKAANEAGIPCETLCERSDHPYEAIIGAAEKKACDLIMMASHGRRGVEGLLLGSETQKVLTHSKVPVLVCR